MWSSTDQRANTGSAADDVLHAVAHALVVADMGDDDSPVRTLVLGPDRAATSSK